MHVRLDHILEPSLRAQPITGTCRLKTKFVLEFKRSCVKENVRIVCLLEFPSVIKENFDCNQISPVGGAKEGLKWLVLH